jgi:16S rRNA processing protein RimM
MMSNESDLIAIGVIRRPVGLDGGCAVMPYGETLDIIDLPCKVFLGITASDVKEAMLIDYAANPKGGRCYFEGVETIEAADALRNLNIFVPSAQIPPLEDGQYFDYELIGMTVIGTKPGHDIGRVEAVEHYPSLDAVDVRTHHGTVITIPLSPDVLINIDTSTRTITVSTESIDELL